MIDLDRFVRSRVDVLNDNGTRGFDQGVRTFDCPLCGDTKNRGWVGVTEMGAGCFNTGCDANPSLPGGAVEWARRVMGLTSRGEAYRHLTQKFSTTKVILQPVAPRGDDWCRLPAEMHGFEIADFAVPVSPSQGFYERFIQKQWGIGLADALRWKLGWCDSGRHQRRVVIPIEYRGHVVGFQTRTIVPGAEPKYLTSQNGPEADLQAECGRPAAALLFNYDAITPGDRVVLVEGAGDVMGWHARKGGYGVGVPPAVALLGTALTPQKLDMLAAARPGVLVVALDPEPAAQVRARLYLADLQAWGIPAILGAWQGAKDAGAGAALVYDASSQKTSYSLVEHLRTLRGE